MNKKVIPIFFTINESYAPFNAVAVKSLIENASKDYKYKIIIIYEDVTKESINKIKSLETENAKIEFVSMKDELKLITNRDENKLRCDYFTLTIYFRIFIADMFPEFDKGIYIDSDIVVPGDISELYNVELGNNLIGACMDASVQEVPELVNYIENADGIPVKQYINSGVLLLNLKLLREKEFSKKFLKLLDTYHFDSIAPDQDYINVMCNGKIHYLDGSWDVMPARNKPELKNPKLIHYNLFDKPWCYDNIQYEEYFWNYAKKTSFYEPILEFKKNYSDDKKNSDKKCFGTMLEKAVSIPESNEITFKKKFERGEFTRV